MANIFSDEWQLCLGSESYSVDVIASITETAIQHILDKHFEYDNDKYTLEINRTLPDGQMNRKFLVRISAKSPIQVQLPPLTVRTAEQRRVAHLYENPKGWDNLGLGTPEPKLYVPRASRQREITPNVRVFCPKFTFHIEWPKLHDNNSHWSWDPKPLNLLAEARITLEMDAEGPYLVVQPTRIKFDQVSKFKLMEDLRRFIEKLPDEERAMLADDDDKFNDLLVIALNIAAVQFGPKLVSSIRLPIPVLANKKIMPSMLQMENKMVTLGGSLDFSALAVNAQKQINAATNTFFSLLESDIEANGGFASLVAEPGQPEVTSPKKLKVLSPNRISAKLERVNAFLRELESKVARGNKAATSRSGRRPAVPNGFGIGVNEYFLNSVAQAAMPQPINKCTDEHSILDFLKGWACYWVKLYNPLISINGTNVSGQINVDVGGALHACVRKFWDCSWSWSCAELDLAVRGNPGLDLELLPGKGIAFSGQITGQLDLETNLPDPFNAVIKAFSGIIWDGVKVILNVFLSMITIQVFPPAFSLPEQKTKLQFSDFTPFGFLRNKPATLPAPKLKYIGYSVGVTATS